MKKARMQGACLLADGGMIRGLGLWRPVGATAVKRLPVACGDSGVGHKEVDVPSFGLQVIDGCMQQAAVVSQPGMAVSLMLPGFTLCLRLEATCFCRVQCCHLGCLLGYAGRVLCLPV